VKLELPTIACSRQPFIDVYILPCTEVRRDAERISTFSLSHSAQSWATCRCCRRLASSSPSSSIANRFRSVSQDRATR